MPRKPYVVVIAYIVDCNDVSEPQQAYEWIVKLSKIARPHVITTGSRINELCGLEAIPHIKLSVLKPCVNWKFLGVFDQVVQPGYIEFFYRARKHIKQLKGEEHIDFGHHLTPQSVRYPSPFVGSGIPFLLGPLHGGMVPPDILRELGADESFMYHLRKLDFIREKYDRRLKFTFESAERVILTAPYMKRVVKLGNPGKQVVISGTAIDEPEYLDRGKSVNEKLRFIFAARLVASKGLELVIEAASLIKEQSFEVHIYGRGGLEEYYKALAEARGLANKFIWHGFVEAGVLEKSFASADVLLHPSLKEPSGIVLLKGMSYGLPVVCANSGGPEDFVTDDCGIKVDVGSKQEMIKGFAAAMQLLIESPKVIPQMSICAKKRVEENYTWSAVVSEMAHLYSYMCSR